MSSPGKSLKDKTRLPLVLVIVANVLVFYLVSQAPVMPIEGLTALLNHWVGLIPAGGAVVITSIITAQFDSVTKARLVFWRWTDPMPGNRAFSELALADHRIDVARLTRKLGTLPTTPREQNSQWYRLYVVRQNDPTVEHVHRDYIFTRDYTAISAMMLLIGAALGLWLIGRNWFYVAYMIGLALQYLVVRRAAKRYGERFVTTVLALTAAS